MRKLLLFSIIAFSVLVLAFSNNPFHAVSQIDQVIKFNDVPYDGKRIYIGPVSVFTSLKGNSIKYKISNTGRKDLRLGGDYSDVVVNLDPTVNLLGNQKNIKSIVEDILAKKRFIKAGAVLHNQDLSISNTSTVASNSAAKASKPSKSSKSKSSKTSDKAEPKPLDLGNGTVVLEMPEKANSNRSKFLNPDDCPDLMIKNIEVIKLNKFMIAIEYTVKNQGTGSAMLLGPKNTSEDNMFLKAYLSATPKFTRSAVEIGESPVRKEVGNKEGKLDRTREFKGKMYFNVRGRTNLTPYLILTLDPYQTVRECNERNNRSYINLDK